MTYLVESDRVKHETEVHASDGHVGNNGEPEKLPQGDMLGYR